MKKIMIIIGTRPEATKMGTLIQEMKSCTEWFDVKVVVTGQHKEQLYQVMDNFDIEPDIDLEIMKENQSLAYITTRAISGLDDIVSEEKPDFILVHGDTQTSFSGALVGFLHQIPVGHVEAGLRSHNKYSPWPEEINRKLVDVVTDYLFAPTENSVENLKQEGYVRENIYITGQTAIDAAIIAYKKDHIFKIDKLNAIDFSAKRVITMTAHRRENRGKPMEQMFRAIRRVVDDHPDVLVIYPVHLSPIVRKHAYDLLSNHDRILLIEPVDFFDLINLQARSHFIISDSGGLQEEASVFNKPLVLMRDTTERPEAIEKGTVYLAGIDEEPIYEVTTKLLNDPEFYESLTIESNPFGDGKASKRIRDVIAYHFGFIENLPEEFGSSEKLIIFCEEDIQSRKIKND